MKILKYNVVRILITLIASTIISYSITFISGKVNFLERFTLAVTDIDFSDEYYRDRAVPPRDTNIVIINIGFLNRAELSQIVKIISANKPKAIGADVFFGEEGDSLDVLGTHMLADAFKSINHDVLAYGYLGKDENDRDLTEGQSPVIKEFVTESVVNLNIATDDPEMGTVRSFNPLTTINGKNITAFGFSVASFVDQDVLRYVSEVDMFIRWYGYGQRDDVGDSLVVFNTFDGNQVMNGEFSRKDFENKIVMLGFMGRTLDNQQFTVEDKFYSPLNEKMVGRSLPDMHGVEIHANIVKMIIDRDFIYHSETMDFLINYAVLTLLTVLLMWINTKYGRQYSILSKIALIIFIDLLLFIAIEVFSLTDGGFKIIISNGLFIMLFLPDTYEFLDNNLFNRNKPGSAPIQNP